MENEPDWRNYPELFCVLSGDLKILLTTYRKKDQILGPTLTYCECFEAIRKILLTTYRKMAPIEGQTLTYCGCCQGIRKIQLTTYMKTDPIGAPTLS